MDQFTYGYGTASNRLLNVADAVGVTSNTDDIESGQVANNYQYDLLGQLISDNQEGILNYNWRLSDRKLRSITGVSTKADVNFIYNPFGQRVVKIVKPKVNGLVDKQSNWIYTYYSYDANGQVMAVYDCKLDPTNATLNKATLKEQHLYGSQRLGMVNKNTLLYQSNTAYTAISPLVQNTYGNTNYELNNHLGNVNAVITDRRFWNTTTLKYEAVVEMKKDYYPFGMAMPGRTFNSDSYRYGYNGMELDNEVSGNGNSYTTEFRQYDPRLGRWKSLDPLMAQFPWQSPYCAFDNNPVFYNDPLGLAAEGGEKELPEIKVTAKRINEPKKLTNDVKMLDSFFEKSLISFAKSLNILQQKQNNEKDPPPFFPHYKKLLSDPVGKVYTKKEREKLSTQFDGYDKMIKIKEENGVSTFELILGDQAKKYSEGVEKVLVKMTLTKIPIAQEVKNSLGKLDWLLVESEVVKITFQNNKIGFMEKDGLFDTSPIFHPEVYIFKHQAFTFRKTGKYRYRSQFRLKL